MDELQRELAQPRWVYLRLKETGTTIRRRKALLGGGKRLVRRSQLLVGTDWEPISEARVDELRLEDFRLHRTRFGVIDERFLPIVEQEAARDPNASLRVGVYAQIDRSKLPARPNIARRSSPDEVTIRPRRSSHSSRSRAPPS